MNSLIVEPLYQVWTEASLEYQSYDCLNFGVIMENELNDIHGDLKNLNERSLIKISCHLVATVD